MQPSSAPYDVVIAGAGPVGAALALGLADSGLRTALLDARPRAAAADDARHIALSHGSRLILERLGAWPLPDPVTPIERITVSQQRGFGRVELSAAEAAVPALGYVVRYATLQRALTAALDRSTAEIVTDCSARKVAGDAALATLDAELSGEPQRFEARLIVIADGGANLALAHLRTRDYRQSALVCDVATGEPHRNRAFERFTPDGPLALLPAPGGWSLVWTAAPERVRELAAAPEADFCGQLEAAFGTGLGGFRVQGPRSVFPLVLKHSTRPVAPRTVLIGNAAQSLHPVAGQGLNLGLRDAWELAREIVARGAPDPGASAFTNAYCSQRRYDRIATILFTDTLIRLFSKDIPLLAYARGGGLAALNGLAPAKNFLVRRMMFGARG